jgi:hypothetical protein
MRLRRLISIAVLLCVGTSRADDASPVIESVDFQPVVHRAMPGFSIVDRDGEFALSYSFGHFDQEVWYSAQGQLRILGSIRSGTELAGFEDGVVTASTPEGAVIVGPGVTDFRSIGGFLVEPYGRGIAGRTGGAMLGVRYPYAGGQQVRTTWLRTADGRERQVSNLAWRLAAPHLLVLAEDDWEDPRCWEFHYSVYEHPCNNYWTQVPGKDPVELGPRDGGLFIRGANSRLDFLGARFPNAIALIDGQLHEFAPDDGMNYAESIAVTTDGQIIGRQGDGEDTRKGAPLWVARRGSKHDLMPDLVERIGPIGEWWTLAASETGWVIGYDRADPMPHIWRIKIRVSDDVDEDGLLDAWEQEGGGIDVDGDGVVELDEGSSRCAPKRWRW